MSKHDLPSPEVLRQLLRYDEKSGLLFWRERTAKHGKKFAAWNARYAGKEALSYVGKKGYKVGSVLGNIMSAHVAAYMIYYNARPENIDHINGNRQDNRILNLRSVSKRENSLNRAIQSNNTSGCTGVIFLHKLNKWQSRIKINGKYISLGCFKDFSEAVKVRKEAEAKHGFHPNHGRSV